MVLGSVEDRGRPCAAGRADGFAERARRPGSRRSPARPRPSLRAQGPFQDGAAGLRSSRAGRFVDRRCPLGGLRCFFDRRWRWNGTLAGCSGTRLLPRVAGLVNSADAKAYDYREAQGRAADAFGLPGLVRREGRVRNDRRGDRALPRLPIHRALPARTVRVLRRNVAAVPLVGHALGSRRWLAVPFRDRTAAVKGNPARGTLHRRCRRGTKPAGPASPATRGATCRGREIGRDPQMSRKRRAHVLLRSVKRIARRARFATSGWPLRFDLARIHSSRFVWDPRNHLVRSCPVTSRGLCVAGLVLSINANPYGETEEVAGGDRVPSLGLRRCEGVPRTRCTDAFVGLVRPDRGAPAHEGEPALERQGAPSPAAVPVLRTRRQGRLGAQARQLYRQRREVQALTARFQGSRRRTGRIREPGDQSLARGCATENGRRVRADTPGQRSLRGRVPGRVRDGRRPALRGRSSTSCLIGVHTPICFSASRET